MSSIMPPPKKSKKVPTSQEDFVSVEYNFHSGSNFPTKQYSSAPLQECTTVMAALNDNTNAVETNTAHVSGRTCSTSALTDGNTHLLHGVLVGAARFEQHISPATNARIVDSMLAQSRLETLVVGTPSKHSGRVTSPESSTRCAFEKKAQPSRHPRSTQGSQLQPELQNSSREKQNCATEDRQVNCANIPHPKYLYSESLDPQILQTKIATEVDVPIQFAKTASSPTLSSCDTTITTSNIVASSSDLGATFMNNRRPGQTRRPSAGSSSETTIIITPTDIEYADQGKSKTESIRRERSPYHRVEPVDGNALYNTNLPKDVFTKNAMPPAPPCSEAVIAGQPADSTPVTARQEQPTMSTPPELPSSTIDETQQREHRCSKHSADSSEVSGRRCQICSDIASGFHYGVWSCEGCKAFFKRSLQGPVEYVCPATNSCTIDKHRRKCCQACRLKKCVEMGMSRGNCRKERSPRQAKGMKRKSDEIEAIVTSATHKVKKEAAEPNLLPCSSGHPSGKDTHQPPMPITTSPPPVPSVSSTTTNSVLQESPDEMPQHPLVDYLMKIDPPPRLLGQNTAGPEEPLTEMTLMASILKLADMEIVDVISWAKAIPGYTDLKLQDRIHMLEASWMEILVLGLVWRSKPYRDVLIFAEDVHFDKHKMEKANIMRFCEKFLMLARMFAHLDVSREEFVLMRATILLNADLTELNLCTTDNKLNPLQNHVNEAWVHTMKRLHRPPAFQCQLFLLLPHIRQSSLNAIAHILSVKDNSELEETRLDLLFEMVDARVVGPPKDPIKKDL